LRPALINNIGGYYALYTPLSGCIEAGKSADVFTGSRLMGGSVFSCLFLGLAPYRANLGEIIDLWAFDSN